MFKIKRLLFVFPIAIMIVIFIFSSQTATQSTSVSDGIVKRVVISIAKINQKIDVEKTTKIVNVIVRKTAHYVLYALLGGALLFSIALNFSLTLKNKLFYSAITGLLYAISDELHQLFVKGRSGKLLDVGIDFLGVCSGILVLYLIMKKIFKSSSFV